MPFLFVAASKGLAEWGASVGLTKHLYKLGLAEGAADKAVEALNEARHAGQSDWKLVRKEKVEDDFLEPDALERLGRKEKLVEPDIYPGIRGAGGIFKVKPTNVENSILVQQTLAGGEPKNFKLKPADIAAYLIRNARA